MCLMILKCCELRIDFESIEIVNFDKFSKHVVMMLKKFNNDI